MLDTNEFYKSLLTLAIANGEGTVSDDEVEKAFENYQEITGEASSFDYFLLVEKAFHDSLNSIELSDELMKAIAPGTKKVFGGITYVWMATPNAQQPFGWRVNFNPNKKPHTAAVDYDEDTFPSKLSHLIVKKKLGGSTGAELVEDPDTGKLYVKKHGASADHCVEEYHTNMAYKILGVRVPDFQIYNAGQPDATLLSVYMEDTTDALAGAQADVVKDELIDNFVADCLLANWDVYKNDNCLIDNTTGLLYRVDNGGGLRYSAQGRQKGKDFGIFVDELTSMVSNNLVITKNLTTVDIDNQIKDVLKKKDQLLAYFDFDKGMAATMRARLSDLESRLTTKAGKKPKIKSNVTGDPITDMYRDLTEEEIEHCYNAVRGNMYEKDNKNGWKFLKEICNLRGFDNKPEVLSPDEFRTKLADSKSMLINRGLTSAGSDSALGLMGKFMDAEADDLFYGNTGMYGAGIYGALNKAKENDSKLDSGYQTAYEYAEYKKEHILDIILDDSAKIVDSQKLDDEMYAEFFGPEYATEQANYDLLSQDIRALEDKINNIDKVITDRVKSDMNWNDVAMVTLTKELDDKDVDAPENGYDAFKTDILDNTINALGGTSENLPDGKTVLYTLPNGEKFKFNSWQFDIARKQKQPYLKPYNFHVQQFRNFIFENHYAPIRKEIIKQIKDAPDKEILKDQIADKNKEMAHQLIKMNSLKNNGNPNLNKVLVEIAKHPGGEYRGFYAAIKGYDAIIEKRTWKGNTPFVVLLNRTKCFVRNFKEDIKDGK